MSTWIIISWIFVALLTGLNVFVFLKLKTASEQMMKMAFPGSNNMADAMAQMQKQMANLSRGAGGRGGFGAPGKGGGGGGANPGAMDAQLKAAMNMLQQIQQKGGKR